MKKILVLFFLLFLMIGCLGYLLYTLMYAGAKIKHVHITSSFPLVYDADRISGHLLHAYDVQSLQQHLLEKNRQARSISIEKIYPDTLSITVESRVPYANIVPSSQRRVVDEDGVLMSDLSSDSQLPEISASGIPLYLSTVPDWRVVKAVQYIKLFRQISLEIQRIDLVEDGSFFSLSVLDYDIIVPYIRDPGEVSASLQLILGRFRIEKQPIARVDFRFEKPVITFTSGEKISSPLL